MLRVVNPEKTLGEYFHDWWNKDDGVRGGIKTLWHSKYNIPACYTQHEVNEIFTGVRKRWYSDADVRSEVAHMFATDFNGWNQIVDICSLIVNVASWKEVNRIRKKYPDISDENLWLKCPKLLVVLDPFYLDEGYDVMEHDDGTKVYTRSMNMRSYQVFGSLSEWRKVILQVDVSTDGEVGVTINGGDRDWIVWDISFQGVDYVKEVLLE
jgi:hypothetical protein